METKRVMVLADGSQFIVPSDVPPLTGPQIQQHKLDYLQSQITELRRENARLIEGNDLLWEQIANLRTAIQQLERAVWPQTEHIGLAVAVPAEGP